MTPIESGFLVTNSYFVLYHSIIDSNWMWCCCQLNFFYMYRYKIFITCVKYDWMIIRRWVVVYHASVAHHRWEPYHSEGMRQAIANVDALLKKYWADITVMVFKTGASNCAFRISLCKVCEIPRSLFLWQYI
ncbi:hypothetical protein ACFX1X_003658 [Malus domestica]